MLLLNLQHISYWYGRSKERQIFSDLNLSIFANDFISIQGKSGSGKTTLLNLIYGFLRPRRGQISYMGYSRFWLPDLWLAYVRSRHFGFVFQDFRLISNYSVRENILLPLYFSGKLNRKNKRYTEDLAKKLGVYGLLARKPYSLSGGEKQRVAILRAIVHNPRIIVADEPTGNLDNANKEIVKNLFEEIYADLGISVIIVTHDDSLAAIGKRRFTIENGKLKEKSLLTV